MKKILLFTFALLTSVAVFTACDDDRDSNPTFHEPTEFVLNTPAYATTYIDLESSETLSLTFSQPNYGYTAAVTYQVQVSLDGDWSIDADDIDEDSNDVPTCATVNESYSSCAVNVSASLFASAIMEIGKWEDEDAMPDELEVYVRVIATVDKSVCYSNVITMSVIPMFVALDTANVDIWFILGAEIGDGLWGSAIGTQCVPMSIVANAEYDKNGRGLLQYIGYFLSGANGGMFKLIHTPGDWAEQWGNGNGDGIDEPVKNDGGSSNFVVPEDGYYVVSLNTATDVVTIEPYEEAVSIYDIYISGNFNGWATDELMTPVAVNVENHDWVYNLELSEYDEVKFLANGSWDKNWGATDFPFGLGENNGPNIPLEAGSYTICFNDITGFYYIVTE